MPHSQLEGRRKPLNTRYVTIAAHAIRGNHYAVFVFCLKISYVFKLQDQHNASFKIYVLDGVASIHLQI